MDTDDLSRTARRAGNHPALAAAARTGYAVSGLMHLLIGWIALQVAWSGGTAKRADQGGALESLAGNTAGQVVLWVAVAGFLGLGLWQLADMAFGHPGGGRDAWLGALKAAGKALVYLVLAWTSLSFARGRRTDSSEQTADVTARLMAQPGGRWLVAGVGLGVLGVAGYHLHKGWRRRFLRDLEEHPGTWAVRAGRVGYLAKGVALAIVGVLFVAAAQQGSAGKATGLDGALRTLQGQPFGTALLTAVAVGFACYGLYSFARARHAKV